MKRFILLAIALMLAIMPASALAAPANATLLTLEDAGLEGDVRCMAQLGDALYVLSGSAVYVLEQGEAKPVRRALEAYPFPEEDGESIQVEYHALCPVDGRMCVAISCARQRIEENGEDAQTISTVDGAYLYELILSGQSAALGDQITHLDWRDLIAGDEDYAYINTVRFPFVQRGALCFLGYDDGQNALLVQTKLQDGSTRTLFAAEQIAPEESVDGVCAYKDGLWLMQCTDWSTEMAQTALYAVDMEAGRVQKLAAFPAAASAPCGLAYCEDTDTLYFCRQGELYAAAGVDVENAQAVAAISVDSSQATPLATADGMYIAVDRDSIVRRNTDPAQRAQRRLCVHNEHYATLENACRAFSGAHGDVEMHMVESTEELVQAMANRSDAVDVYCVRTSSAQYDAVFGRGYMAELGRSQIISSLVQSLYPFARDACTREGTPVAVPVWMYLGGSCGYSPEALDALGISKDELPKTWQQFFAALNPLADKAAESAGVSLFDSGMDRDGLRFALFSSMMSEYIAYISQPGNEFAFDTPMFRELIAAFEAVNWDALGLASVDPETGEQDAPAQAGKRALFYNYCDPSAGNTEGAGQNEPLLLRLADGVEPILQAELTLSFVNPYSRNMEDAVAYLETVAQSIDPLLMVHLSPEHNEPVRSASYEASLADYDRQIAALEEQIASADADEKPAYEEMLAQAQEEKKAFLSAGAWDASKESIARYRRFAPYVVTVRNAGLVGESAEVFFTQQSQYLDGLIDAGEMIRTIDGKLQMMVREGM